MVRRILVPLDGSRFAETALPTALHLAWRDGAELDLVMVQEASASFVRTAAAPLREGALDREQEFQSRVYLEALSARLAGGHHGRFGTMLLGGRVVTSLLEHIAARATDVIVMTTHARGGLSRAWLGSVADGLVRRSPAPVLLIRPGDEEGAKPAGPPFARVLLPLDGGPGGAQIMEPALQVARTEGVEYHVLRVLVPAVTALAEVLPHRGEEPATRAQQATVESVLEGAAETLRARGATARAETITSEGAASGILRYADEQGIDLIAMTTRSRGGLERWLLGSVADKVLRGATVPLLLHNPAAVPESG